MKRASELDQLDWKAQAALKRLYDDSASKGSKMGRKSQHSWRVVARDLGFAPGYVYNVYIGYRRASNRLLAALHLPPRKQLVDVCPIHGVAHPRKTCPPAKPAAPRAHVWARECKAWQDVALRAIGAILVDVGGEAQTGYIME